MFIDIHDHILFGVDDGPKSFEESKQLLKTEAYEGASAVIFTPHFRHGMFEYDREKIDKAFSLLSDCGKELGVQLYLGCEYHVDRELIENIQQGRVHTLADGDYFLAEFDYGTRSSEIISTVKSLSSCGLCAVIAHAERYLCIERDPSVCEILIESGAVIQINASAILGYDGLRTKRLCKKLLCRGYAGVVASDTHNLTDRRSRMAECYAYLTKKYGDEYADELMYRMPSRIIGKNDGR